MSIRGQTKTWLERILWALGGTTVDALLKFLLTKEVIEDAIMGLFDFIEEYVRATDTPLDDMVLRRVLAALDLDEEEETEPPLDPDRHET